MSRYWLCILFLCISITLPLTSQEIDPRIVEMDIRTSSLAELASWARSLGLSEGGTRNELANRLRVHFGLPFPDTPQSVTRERIITIESARTTEYFTLDVVNEEYARLQGGVIVSLIDEEAVHRIRADTILFNRTRNVMTAEGSVEYTKEEGETIEMFRGDSITVNLDSWSSIFLDGAIERSMSSEGTVYRFAGEIISRSDEEVTVLRRAIITNATNEEAYWSLNARRLWLLPGGDWAVLSAVLKVGEIPVFYFPFFHFAADEPLFHPAMGFRSRTGNFVQTTTYILGRRQGGGSENSISQIMGGGANSERVREGIFLRSTGRNIRDNNDTRLSVLFDAYSNLGVYLGSELALPRRGILESATVSSGMGFTRDIYRLPDSRYTPFSNGVDNWNSSNLFSTTVPFRYRFHAIGSLRGRYGTFNWNIPFHSDQMTNRDFLDRSEVIDWVALFRQETYEESTNTIGSFDWRLGTSLTTSAIPAIQDLRPYVSSLSLASDTSLLFRGRASPNSINNRDPVNWHFFYPDMLTIYSLRTSISGTPLTLGERRTSATATVSKEDSDAAFQEIFQGAGIPRSPWAVPVPDETTNAPSADPFEQLTPPALTQSFSLPLIAGGPRFTTSYTLSPTSATQLQFRSSTLNWRAAEDIDWSQYSFLSTNFRSSGNIAFTLEQPETSLYRVVFRVVADARWQDTPYINEEAEEFITNGEVDQIKIDNVRFRDYSATLFTTEYDYTTSFRPLYRNAIFGTSSLQYDLRGRLTRTAFDETGGRDEALENPSWKTDFGGWTSENVSTHSMTANFAASVRDYMQNLSISTELPPVEPALRGSATVRAWISETNVNHRIKNPWDLEEIEFEPVFITQILRFRTVNFTQNVTYTPEYDEITNLTSNLTWTWVGLTASFSAIRSPTYSLETTGWVENADSDRLNPREFRVTHRKTFTQEGLWGRRLGFSVTPQSAVTFDLQRYTNSNLAFELNFEVTVTNFLNVKFSSRSENQVMFRYFQRFTDMPLKLPGEENIFTDLINSFRFDNEALRRSSGFKLRSFGIDLIHHLGDWNATLGVNVSPYLDQTAHPSRYRFRNEISFVVQWIPINEIRSEISTTTDERWIIR